MSLWRNQCYPNIHASNRGDDRAFWRFLEVRRGILHSRFPGTLGTCFFWRTRHGPPERSPTRVFQGTLSSAIVYAVPVFTLECRTICFLLFHKICLMLLIRPRRLAMASILYHEGNRAFQDEFDSRRLADRLEKKLSRTAFSDDDKTFIESCIYFFIA